MRRMGSLNLDEINGSVHADHVSICSTRRESGGEAGGAVGGGGMGERRTLTNPIASDRSRKHCRHMLIPVVFVIPQYEPLRTGRITTDRIFG